MLRTGPELYPLREGLVNQPCFHPHRHSVANLQTAADEDNELRRPTSVTLLQENSFYKYFLPYQYLPHNDIATSLRLDYHSLYREGSALTI